MEESANKYIGVPWKAGAYNENGMDCIGLIVAILFDLGIYKREQIQVPRYSQVPTGNLMLKTMAAHLKRVGQPVHGGIVTFAQWGTNIYHAGVIGEKHFYHAFLPEKKVVKISLTENALKDRRACFLFERPDETVTPEGFGTTRLTVES